MSSIYRKGRDGYFYYQAYTINPESSKKDKRVYHSLNTKDETEAKKKKKEYDLKYEKVIDVKNKRITKYFKNSKILFSFFLLMMLSITFYSLQPRVSIKNKRSFQEINFPKKEIKDLEQISVVKPTEKKPINKELKTQDSALNEAIPDFIIERVDQSFGAFKQIKVYATLNDNTNDVIQNKICQIIAHQFKEFPNIIICLYSDNPNGKKMANGYEDALSSDVRKTSWLAFYTKNPVEGDYFDANPNGF
tara:strand:+ start:29 stop:772 length:744 start_codon:yes stop_codon:yes gene_type:complete